MGNGTVIIDTPPVLTSKYKLLARNYNKVNSEMLRRLYSVTISFVEKLIVFKLHNLRTQTKLG